MKSSVIEEENVRTKRCIGNKLVDLRVSWKADIGGK
jgi:hypothetical protein